jgi:HK97 family phage prohead protease
MSTDETRKTFTADERKALAAKGHAMPDGSFPIENTEDLKNAIHLAGNAKDPAAAKAHIKKRAAALGASKMIPTDWEEQQENSAEPPRDELYRALDASDALELRSTEESPMPILCGHFSVFNTWAEIRSKSEGHFMEQVAPGAFARTITQNRDRMRVMVDHGQHPRFGTSPLGPLTELREDDTGGYYEVPLLDTTYNRDLVPALEAGLYGSSFRFSVLREKFNKSPRASDANPDGLPERTILEARVRELGPVAFPAYGEATAGVRSITDYILFRRFTEDSEYLESLVSSVPEEAHTALGDTPRANTARVSQTRDPASTYLYGTNRRKQPSWRLPQ